MAPSAGRVTTNELRRKVAARMRELLDENKYISLDALVVRSIGDDLPDGMGYERMLADLIDSPKASRKRFTADELREPPKSSALRIARALWSCKHLPRMRRLYDFRQRLSHRMCQESWRSN